MNSQVILVDDSLEDAELAVRALKKSNPHTDVRWIEDGNAAIALINSVNDGSYNEGIVKLFMFDIKMFEVSGFELLELVRKGDNTAIIPTIILSSSKLDKDIKKAYALGANSYIEKPANFKDYLHKMDVVSKYWLEVNTL